MTLPAVSKHLRVLERAGLVSRRRQGRQWNCRIVELRWKPHPKSSSLGQLALHTAQVPAALARILTPDTFIVAPFVQAEPGSSAELLPALEESMAAARAFLEGLTPERAMATWKLFNGDREIMSAPRIGMVRALMFNHWYHHRGQIQVYLRMLDIPVPSVYGPTADENPFMT